MLVSDSVSDFFCKFNNRILCKPASVWKLLKVVFWFLIVLFDVFWHQTGDFFSPFNVKLTQRPMNASTQTFGICFVLRIINPANWNQAKSWPQAFRNELPPTLSSHAGISPSSFKKMGSVLSTNIPPSSTGYRHTLHAQDLLFRRSEHRTNPKTFWPRVQRHDRNTPETPDKRK